MGPAMLPIQELEYTAFRTSLEQLEERFKLKGPAMADDGRGPETARA